MLIRQLDENGKHITFDNTGNKYAACGPESGKWGFGEVTTLKPNAWTTLTWEESISHSGSPFRLALLDETETARLILLDHIPHNDASSPTAYVSHYQTVHNSASGKRLYFGSLQVFIFVSPSLQFRSRKLMLRTRCRCLSQTFNAPSARCSCCMS
jgi:hypothetical protein